MVRRGRATLAGAAQREGAEEDAQCYPEHRKLSTKGALRHEKQSGDRGQEVGIELHVGVCRLRCHKSWPGRKELAEPPHGVQALVHDLII